METMVIRLSKSSIGEAEKLAVMGVLDREFLGMGVEVQKFEEELTKFFGRPAVCVVNGTAALHLALQAAGLGPGDEVLVQSLTYVASFQAISATGAKPVACDVTPDKLLIDLIIVFGGDGTLLSSTRKYLEFNIPLLGINMGTVGFLTDINTQNFDSVIQDILINNNYEIEERNLVSASFLDKIVYGLNEIVIHSGGYTQLMRYRLNVNNKVVYEQRSDGLIIATPTGSTAYALSAGGPIIHPSVDVWTILPMLPQSMSSRPFVISSKGFSVLELEVSDNNKLDNKLFHAHWLGATQKQDATECLSFLKKVRVDWLIVDHYGIDTKWEEALNFFYNKLLVIDDLADRNHICDVLLDQNLGSDLSTYKDLVPANCKTFFGA